MKDGGLSTAEICEGSASKITSVSWPFSLGE